MLKFYSQLIYDKIKKKKTLILQVIHYLFMGETAHLKNITAAVGRTMRRRCRTAAPFRSGLRFDLTWTQSLMSQPLRLQARFSQAGSPVPLANVHLTGSQSKLASYT